MLRGAIIVKNKKFIMGTLILAMALLGTGYAYWNDTIQVNTQITTGYFDVDLDTIETAANSDNEYVIFEATEVTDTEEIVNDTSKEATTDNTVTFTIGGLYPSVNPQGTVSFKMVNRGNMQAILSQSHIVDASGNDLTKETKSELFKYVKFKVNDQDEVGIAGLLTAIKSEIGTTIEPGESTPVVEIQVRLSELADDATQNISEKFTIDFVWSQPTP